MRQALLFYMANFNTHLCIATATKIRAALAAVNVHLIVNTDMPWLIFLGSLEGLLPDIDASNSRLVKLFYLIRLD